jgi:tetratricopeptide (TPR) repeat protein
MIKPIDKYMKQHSLIRLLFNSLTVTIIWCQPYSTATAEPFADSSIIADSAISIGNQHYINHMYDMAIQNYHKVIALSYESGVLYYNLGNAYYKQNEVAMAILYYEKALLLRPNDEDIRLNLSIANARVVDQIDIIPVFFIKRWFIVLRNMLSPNQWAYLNIILFVLALTGLLFYVVGRKFNIKKIGFYAGIVMLLVTITGLFLMRSRIQNIINNNSAIIMMSPVNARSSPDEQSTNVFILHEGTKVTVIDSMLNWKEIRIADGNKGWIPSEVIEKI